MTKKGNNWMPAFAGMTDRGAFGDDKKICHSGMGLAGIQYAVPIRYASGIVSNDKIIG